MAFLTEVLARIEQDRAVLLADLVYEGKAERWVVGEGFWTDFASVPRAATWLVPRMGTHTRAAIVHDWFCVGLARGDCPVSSADADGIFRRIMREEGTGWARRWLAWAAVRWAAGFSRGRRAGWWRTLPLLLLVTAVVLLVAGLAVLLAWAVVTGALAWWRIG